MKGIPLAGERSDEVGGDDATCETTVGLTRNQLRRSCAERIEPNDDWTRVIRLRLEVQVGHQHVRDGVGDLEVVPELLAVGRQLQLELPRRRADDVDRGRNLLAVFRVGPGTASCRPVPGRRRRTPRQQRQMRRADVSWRPPVVVRTSVRYSDGPAKCRRTPYCPTSPTDCSVRDASETFLELAGCQRDAAASGGSVSTTD